MATASQIILSPAEAGVCHADNISIDAARKASEVLQKNHENHHDVFHLKIGFHNHLVHHILTLYACGATASEIQQGYDNNKGYQLKKLPGNEDVVEALHDKKKFREYEGDQNNYASYETFFAQQIEAKGWEAVLSEYLFAGDDLADNMLCRLLGAFLHPFIQLGFGVEFKQPAIVAEGLAQTACHSDTYAPFWFKAEQLAKETKVSKSVIDLLTELETNEKLKECVRGDDNQKFSEGLMQRGFDEITRIVAQYTVSPEELEEKTAEAINASVYFASAAQNIDKVVKFDFFYMHSVNSQIFLSILCDPSATYLSTEAKCRLLEWKTRLDLAIYKGFGSPKLLLSEVTGYQPRGGLRDWHDVFRRGDILNDDGHGIKLVRALANGERVCARYESKETFKIKGQMWIKIAHMVLDSIEGMDQVDDRWARGVGFPNAWEHFPDRPRL